MGAPKQTPQKSARPIRILSASVDPSLNYTRALLLRQHGFEVTTSEQEVTKRPNGSPQAEDERVQDPDAQSHAKLASTLL